MDHNFLSIRVVRLPEALSVMQATDVFCVSLYIRQYDAGSSFYAYYSSVPNRLAEAVGRSKGFTPGDRRLYYMSVLSQKHRGHANVKKLSHCAVSNN
jgi:hypothetical protein